MLRWRFLRWRKWKKEFSEVTKDHKQLNPYIAAWFYKKYENNQVAEIKVYCKKLQLKREEKKTLLEHTTQYREQHELHAEGLEIHDHLVKTEKVGEINKIAKQET